MGRSLLTGQESIDPGFPRWSKRNQRPLIWLERQMPMEVAGLWLHPHHGPFLSQYMCNLGTELETEIENILPHQMLCLHPVAPLGSGI